MHVQMLRHPTRNLRWVTISGRHVWTWLRVESAEIAMINFMIRTYVRLAGAAQDALVAVAEEPLDFDSVVVVVPVVLHLS